MNAHSGDAARFSVELPDGAMAGWRWRRDGAPPLLFCHATGFCASAYRQMLTRAASQFDVYALDLRGHGRTALPCDAAALRDWSLFARDVGAFLDRADRDGWTLGGHSLGAVVAALAARGRGDVAAVRLLEPVAMPTLVRWAAMTPLWRALSLRMPPASLARRRRRDWPDRETIRRAYAGKRLFARFAKGALDDYLLDGVVDAAGGVRLACDPAWETATFTAQAHDFWEAVRSAPAPVSVLASDGPDSTVRAFALRRLRRLRADVRITAAGGHLFPMEAPDAAAVFLSGTPRDV